MKKRSFVHSYTIFAAALVLLTGALISGCTPLLGKLENSLPKGMGRLTVSLSGKENRSGLNPALTMLASDPEFTGYELYVTPSGGTDTTKYSSTVALFQLTLPDGTYTISAAGLSGDKITAKTWDLTTKALITTPVTISSGSTTPAALPLSPYMDPDVYGTLNYSLNWDSVGQIPLRAEILVEQYNNDAWEPIPISLMNDTLTAGAAKGTVVLLQKETGLVQQTGSLQLPPGEYRLTTTVAMDGPYPPLSRTDIAHVFSNLITPAAFFYGSGDLIVTNPGFDTGAGFITKFNFSETPGASSIIGSNPGADGTRLIMVTVPDGTGLTRLTPVVECAPGAQVSSPPPTPLPDGSLGWTQGDYSRPTSWIAVGRNGVSQQYTVVVNEGPDSDCLITNVAFTETALASTPVIIHPPISIVSGKITVVVPTGTATNSLTPVFSKIGTEIKLVTVTDTPATDTVLSGPIDFSTNKTFRVYAASGVTRKYELTVLTAADPNAAITYFLFDEYPEYPATTINSSSNPGTIAIELPYGAQLNNLTPLVQYSGMILSPAYGVKQNFTQPVNYKVTSWSGSVTKEYTVTVNTAGPNTDTGIFDFVITNVPKAKVVIGTKPRADGKIPIVVQVPYATSPLTTDGSNRTDLQKLIPKITLRNPSLSSISPSANGTTDFIPFGNQNDYQEAVYRVTAQAGNTQDYVVVVARDVQYYYVSAAGNDSDPDQYNGGTESNPFKTLAYAVYQAVKHNVDHIFVIGTLNDASEGGAWENTSATTTGDNGAFQASGGPAAGGGNSVFNLNGSGRNGGSAYPIYITGIGSNAVLQGAGGKRVISITGGADITFENITIQGGGNSTYGGNGGGMYIAGTSRVVWKSGNITGNTALSGGGIYVGSDAANDESEFEFMTGTISGNAATGAAAANFTTGNSPNIQGGGGVYVRGDALFWLASGQVTGNSTRGSGGGVLVNGSAIPDNPTTDTTPHNFIMSAGAVNGNTSTGSVWPHGGGGVYVAKGVFEMLNGQIMNNSSVRQGGGVFVWSRALFWMGGNSSVTANSGVGSSKAICSRGITTMRGNAQADKVYIWNYAKPSATAGSWNNGDGDEFTLMEGARISGLVLAFADDPINNRNYINIVPASGQFFTSGTDPITTVDLESRLTASGSFSTTATPESDWINQYLIRNGGATIPDTVLKRFPLGSFTSGKPSLSLSKYKLDSTGKLAAK